MTSRAQELLREVLTLPIDDRADVAAELLASLDEPTASDPEEIETAWARELEARARRASENDSAGEPAAAVRERIAHQLTDL
jgi:putative addiction module component